MKNKMFPSYPVKGAWISDFENNQRAISKDVAKELAKLFGVGADRFI